MKILNEKGEERSQSAVLMDYFRRPGQTATQFYAELKELSTEDRQELAVGAAKELGLSVVE